MRLRLVTQITLVISTCSAVLSLSTQSFHTPKFNGIRNGRAYRGFKYAAAPLNVEFTSERIEDDDDSPKQKSFFSFLKGPEPEPEPPMPLDPELQTLAFQFRGPRAFSKQFIFLSLLLDAAKGVPGLAGAGIAARAW